MFFCIRCRLILSIRDIVLIDIDGENMHYNKGGFVVLLASVVFSFMWFVYLVYLSPSIDLDELDTLSILAESEEGLSAIQEYWKSNGVLVAQGQRVYQTYCASCHGNTGLGDGLAGGGLNPPPRNLVEGQWQKGGSSIELYKTLIEGIEGTSMVSFSYLSKIDRWALVHFVRSITENKVEDDEKQLEDFAKADQ